jgi:hypothetical protein
MRGTLTGLQQTAPSVVYRQVGYSAGLTRYVRSPEGRGAGFPLAQGPAQTTSYSYGYKWARFLDDASVHCSFPARVYIGYGHSRPVDCGYQELRRRRRLRPAPTLRPMIKMISLIFHFPNDTIFVNHNRYRENPN